MRNFFFGGLELGVMALVTLTLLSKPPLMNKDNAQATTRSVYAMAQHR